MKGMYGHEIPDKDWEKIKDAYKKLYDKQEEVSKVFGYVPMSIISQIK